MAELDRRSFDVTRPKQVSANPTSKPIIVGHHPMMTDPTLRDTSVPLMKHSVEPPKATKIAISAGDEESSSAPSSEPAPTSEHGQFGGEAPAGAPEPPAPIAPVIPEEPPVADTPALDPSEASELPKDDDPNLPQGPKPAPPHSDSDVSSTLEDLHLPVPHVADPPRRLGSALLLPLIILVTLLAVYGLVAAKTSISLPYNPFKKNTPTPTRTTTAPQKAVPATTPATTSNVPTGFSEYKLDGTSISFDYPTVWGTPKVTSDPGFSKRGGTNKTDGTYAYLVDFGDNKDIQLALTSVKLLPAARGTQYYDYLQWCVGTADQKFYKQIMHYVTTSQVDTPTTTTCDQGPLDDATKVDDSTIVQAKTKGVDNKTVIGDIYTKNLLDTNYVVLRVKDATMTNGDNIKKLLGTVQSSAQ
jgi:hypothetical protein